MVGRVLGQAAEQRAHDVVAAALGVEVRVGGQRALARLAPEVEVVQLLLVDQLRLEPVVEIVADVGDLVGEVDRLRLERGRDEAVDQLVRRVGLVQALEHFPRQVEPVELGIFQLEFLHDAQALRVVAKAAVAGHELVQRFLAEMAEGRMAEVVRERDGLGEVLVEAEGRGPSVRAMLETSMVWVMRVR